MKYMLMLLQGIAVCCVSTHQLAAQLPPQIPSGYQPAPQYQPTVLPYQQMPAQYPPVQQYQAPPVYQPTAYSPPAPQYPQHQSQYPPYQAGNQPVNWARSNATYPQVPVAYPTTSVATAPAMFNPPPASPQPPPQRMLPAPPQNTSQHRSQTPAEQIAAPQNVVSPQKGTNYASDMALDSEACAPCGDVCDPPYFSGYGPFSAGNVPSVTASGLIFTRGQPEFYQMSFDTTDVTGSVIDSTTGTGNWDAGPEIRIMWPLGCRTAVQGVYWGLYGDNTESTVYGADLPGNLNTTFDFTFLNIGTDNVNDLYDGAAAHRLRRNYNIHNVEINFLYGDLMPCNSHGLQLSYLAGFRYLRMTEGFEYATAFANPVFGADPGSEAYYNIDLANNLWGVQLGLRGDWYVKPRFSLYGSTKFGIYNNHIDHHSVISNVNGIATFGVGNPLAGQQFDIVSDTNVGATIGELDLGMSYRLGLHWNAAIGYRVIGVTGLALPTNQVPSTGRMPGVEGINHNSTMLLHGAYASIGLIW